MLRAREKWPRGDVATVIRIRFVGAFGTTEQIVNALHPDPEKPLDAATANLVLALLYRIGPRGAHPR